MFAVDRRSGEEAKGPAGYLSCRVHTGFAASRMARWSGEELALEPDIKFELAGGPYAVTAARLALADLDSTVDPSTAFDVRLLVSELVTNSVQHASVGAEESIRLHVDMGDESVRVEVMDSGPGFELKDPIPDQAT